MFNGRWASSELASQIGCPRALVLRTLEDLEVGGYLAISDEGLRLVRPLPMNCLAAAIGQPSATMESVRGL